MQYDFDTYVERRKSGSVKWDILKERFGADDLLPFWVADMDFKSPPEVIEALRAKLDHGVLGYPAIRDTLLGAVAHWQRARHGWHVDHDWIEWAPGIVAGLSFAMIAFTEPDESVIIQTPVYHPFFSIVKSSGRKLIANPLRREAGRYVMDLEHLESLITPKCRTLILCSPHNPIMRVWTKTELAALADLAKRRDLLILTDEIHQDLVYSDSKHTCFASLSEDAANRSVTFVAPSKTFNIAGLASSCAVIPNEKLRAAYALVLERFDLNGLNLMGQVAMEAAYSQCADWVDQMMAYMEGNRDFVATFIETNMPKAKMNHPEGTYIFWIDFSGYGLSGDALQKFLIQEARVALNDGRAFGPEGDGFARLNIGTTRAQLEEGLTRIADALKRL